jgi:hypothetical protein
MPTWTLGEALGLAEGHTLARNAPDKQSSNKRCSISNR